MLASHARLILGDAYASWEEGDVLRTLSYFTDDVVFAVHSSSDAASLVGAGLGRDEFGRRLEMFLRQFEVEEFALQRVTTKGVWVRSSVAFRYRHRISGMAVDGTMRHKWLFLGDEIAHFELFYDSPLMRAFYKLAAAE
jgi:ketosteroid isomerase-like protein